MEQWETDNTYLGTGWAFPPAFIKNQGVALSDDEEDIAQSLHILFSTSPGERIFRYDYGCPLRRWVFEEMNSTTQTQIADAIRQAVLYFEPRIELEDVRVAVKAPSEGILWITIAYRTRATNNRSNRVYPFHFKEGTNL